MAVIGLFYVHIVASDLDRSKQFYRDRLGWTLGTDEPGVAGFHFGSGYLVVTQAGENGPGVAPPEGMMVAVQVDDIVAQHDLLVQGGVAVSPIDAKPWGEKSFGFTDPDGYRWQYGQHNSPSGH